MRSAASQGLFLLGKGTHKQKGPSARLKRVSEKRKSHAEETAKIREAVFKRADGACEFCGQANHPCRPSDMHHLEGGSGRTALQAISNCVAVCRLCHRGYHKDPERYRNLVVRWTGKYGYPIPRRFRGPPKQIVEDAATAAKEAVSAVHEPIARKAQ